MVVGCRASVQATCQKAPSVDSTTIIITTITVGATLIAAVVAAAWRVGRLTGGLQQSVTDGARASSDAHASIGQRIDQTRNELRADIADSARTSSDAHASIGQRIDQTRNELHADIGEVGRRVDRVLEAQAAQGGDSGP